MMSAGASIRLFFLSLILSLVLITVGAGLAHQWWANRQNQQRRQEALERAQLYTLMNGQIPQAPPQIDISALLQTLQATQAQTHPMSGFFPPNESGDWKVL